MVKDLNQYLHHLTLEMYQVLKTVSEIISQKEVQKFPIFHIKLSKKMLPFFLIFLTLSLVLAQQPYVGKDITKCAITYNSSSAFGYYCNGINKTCQSYLTFRSIYPYNTVSSISQLLKSDPIKLSQLNLVNINATFEVNQLVLVPVSCSCYGLYYQTNTTYTVAPNDNFLIIANNTFQGLSTCQAIKAQNILTTKDIYPGMKLNIPLRCACPTTTQTSYGFKYLLSYLVAKGQYVYLISNMFGADTGRTLQANGLSEQDSTIFPYTTLLVPLKNPPSLSQTLATPPPPPHPPPPSGSANSPNNSSKNKTWVYALVGALGGGLLMFLIFIIVFCVFFRKKKKKADSVIITESFEAIEKNSQKGEENEIDTKEFLDSISTIAHSSLKVYKFDELISATNNFSPECWIKGSVYRGKFKGDYAAIKEVDGDVSDEINLLNKISHSNLIRLSGVCFNKGHWYLIYEYASNGSLSDWIYNNNIDRKFLSWTQRMQIALDVAMGLNYIHNYTSPPYVHKNLTSNNVLLDSDFRAKVANLGLARSTEKGESAFTRHIVGTQGYMAPEYLENGLISTKLDVYAFGVLMLELLTGKEAVVLHKGSNKPLSHILSDLVDEKNGNENLRKFVDISMEGNYPMELVVFAVRLVQNCLKKDQSSRPGMDEIVQSLLRIFNNSLDWETSNNNSGYWSFS